MRSRASTNASCRVERMKAMRSLRFAVFASGALAAIGFAATANAQQAYRYQTGKEVYEHICQACHMADAKGATGAGTYPALAGNPRLETALYPVTIILQGLKSM